jgi:hypothetical protein
MSIQVCFDPEYGQVSDVTALKSGETKLSTGHVVPEKYGDLKNVSAVIKMMVSEGMKDGEIRKLIRYPDGRQILFQHVNNTRKQMNKKTN